MAGIGHHAVQFLKSNPDKRFTAREIVNGVLQVSEGEFARKRAALLASKPDFPFEQQLVAELGRDRPTLQKRYPELMTDESARPKLYYWKIQMPLGKEPEVTVPASNPEPDPSDEQVGRDEKSMYEPVRQYLHSELGILSSRIDEKTSKNNRGPRANQWLHPDIAGMLPKGRNWQAEVLQCA